MYKCDETIWRRIEFRPFVFKFLIKVISKLFLDRSLSLPSKVPTCPTLCVYSSHDSTWICFIITIIRVPNCALRAQFNYSHPFVARPSYFTLQTAAGYEESQKKKKKKKSNERRKNGRHRTISRRKVIMSDMRQYPPLPIGQKFTCRGN